MTFAYARRPLGGAALVYDPRPTGVILWVDDRLTLEELAVELTKAGQVTTNAEWHREEHPGPYSVTFTVAETLPYGADVVYDDAGASLRIYLRAGQDVDHVLNRLMAIFNLIVPVEWVRAPRSAAAI